MAQNAPVEGRRGQRQQQGDLGTQTSRLRVLSKDMLYAQVAA